MFFVKGGNETTLAIANSHYGRGIVRGWNNLINGDEKDQFLAILEQLDRFAESPDRKILAKKGKESKSKNKNSRKKPKKPKVKARKIEDFFQLELCCVTTDPIAKFSIVSRNRNNTANRPNNNNDYGGRRNWNQSQREAFKPCIIESGITSEGLWEFYMRLNEHQDKNKEPTGTAPRYQMCIDTGNWSKDTRKIETFYQYIHCLVHAYGYGVPFPTGPTLLPSVLQFAKHNSLVC